MNRLIVAAGVLVVMLVAGGAARAQFPQDAAGLRQRLAQIELMVSVDRDFAGAEAALAELTADKLPPALAAVLDEPEMKATRGRIQAAIGAARSDDREDLAEVVRTAFIDNDDITLSTLGPRAAALIHDSLVPGADPGPLRNINIYLRLFKLFQLDERLGWELVKDDPLALGEGTEAALLNAVHNAALHWVSYPNRKPELERPEWLDWIARLLDAPSSLKTLGERGQPGLGPLKDLTNTLVQNDAFTPRLAESLASLLTRMDGYAALEILNEFSAPWSPSVQPVLEQLVADPRDAVRRAAAERLIDADTSPGLRSRVDDTDVQIRLALVHSLGARDRQRLVWRDRNSGPGKSGDSLPAAQDDEARQLLARLAADPQPSVREAVIDVLRRLTTPLAPDVYRRLAADPDEQVRRAVVMLDVPDTALQAEIHSTLASDRAASVVNAIDQRLYSADWDKSVDWLAPVLQARLQNGVAPLDSLRSSRMAYSATARKLLVRATLDTGDEKPLSILTGSYFDPKRGVPQGNVQAAEADWLQLEADDFRRLLPLLQKQVPELVTGLANYAVDKTLAPGLAAVGEAAARDDTQPLFYRLATCSLALHEPTPARLELLHELLADPTLGAGTSFGREDAWHITFVVVAIPVEQRNVVIADLLRTIDLRENLAQDIAGRYLKDAPDAEDVMRIILARWLGAGVASQSGKLFVGDLVTRVVGELAQHPALVDEAVMRRVIHAGTDAAWSAVGTMARLRDPRLLDVLRECLDPTWVDYWNNSSPTDLAVDAVDAIHGYMSDEAAQILLDAAANSARPKVREQALAAVDAIGRYRDALAAWQRRKSVGDTRDEAVGRLVAMYTDSAQSHEVRVEALRALGTLGAVEYMPLIIEAIGSSEKDMRDAAREALQKLNAPPPVPAAVPASPAQAEPPKSDG
jgi:HEAT repeat protein